MTDKEQMIVDGVNVSGCEHWNICKQCQLSQLPESGYKLLCKDNPNCSFKQLTRKTQECEELKEEISKLQLNKYHYKNELKKYKKGIHKYRNLLKYEINNLRLSRREFLKMVGRYPKFEKDNIKLALDTFNRKLELIDNPSRYRKALEEIEEECNYAPMCDTEFSERVLDIINKVKGEEKCQ